MQISCLHGYFIFRESSSGEISKFASLFQGLELVAVDDFYTFDFLYGAPEYSIEGGTYLGAPATKTFAGKPWEILFENELVYNFQTNKVVPISSINSKANLEAAANYYLSPGLILPGSISSGGGRITDYAAWYLFGSGKFKYSEVTID